MVVEVAPQHAVRVAQTLWKIGALGLQQDLRRVQGTAGDHHGATRYALLEPAALITIDHGVDAAFRR